ncbi:MAG: glycosyltransferase [Deltaproteobacteria bacterium]|nr:glycosyltransferase [Deltaproteobacteria bacterium]
MSLKRAFFRTLSATLARLPIERASRERLKDWIYGRWGFLFASSPNYPLWLEAHPRNQPRLPWPPVAAPTAADWSALVASESDCEGTPYVVVPVHRGFDETLACLLAVRKTAPGVRLVVVDDASPERRLSGELARLAAAGHFVLLRNDRNVGFARSVQRGIEFDPAADVVLLNSDVIVFGDWLARLRAAASSSPDYGTITPLANNGDIASYPHPQRDQRARLELALEEIDALASRVNGGRVVPAPTGVGFCLYVKRACLDAVGGFGDAFTAGYGEENDFSLRAAAAGWRHGIATDVFVRHEGARSFGRRAARLRRRAAVALEARHPDFLERVEAFVSADPLRVARLRIDAARLRAASRSEDTAVLFVSHDWGGGVKGHLRELAACLDAEGVDVYVLNWLEGDGAPRLRLDPAPGRRPLEDLGVLADLATSDRGALVDALRILRIGHVHVHHTGPAGAEGAGWLRSLVQALSVSFDVTLHDYGAICPRLHLEDERGRYCGEPEVAGCRACLADRGSRFGDVEIEAWRGAFRPLLEDARHVFCPTEDVRARFMRRWSAPDYVVRGHPETPLKMEPVSKAAPSSGQLRVLVPGAINDQKGYRLVVAAAADARRRGLALEYRVVGYTHDDSVARDAGVTVTGRYVMEDADRVLAAQVVEPCLAFLPSLTPETWCATLSSAWRVGLHPVAFDLGALAERIKARGHGSLLPLALSETPAAVNDALLALGREAQVSPSVPGESLVGADALHANYYGGPLPAKPDRGIVFLDRDGVLNQDSPDHIRSLADWRPLPGSLEAVGRLSRAGYRVVVVSNQSGIGRGWIKPEDLDAIHARLRAQVEALGGRLEAILFCPHVPDAGCVCRKPGTGLLEEGARMLGLSVQGALMVGDRKSDAEAALAAGAKPVLVETGVAIPDADDPFWRLVAREPDLATVVDRLLSGDDLVGSAVGQR